jgi:hypothetical protein
MKIDEQLRHFRQTKPAPPFKTQRQWTALCPAHQDHTPSLTITEGTKRAFVKCHAGCGEAAILSAAGLKSDDVWYAAWKGPGKPTERHIAGVMGVSEVWVRKLLAFGRNLRKQVSIPAPPSRRSDETTKPEPQGGA